jgi:hypothetical protein
MPMPCKGHSSVASHAKIVHLSVFGAAIKADAPRIRAPSVLWLAVAGLDWHVGFAMAIEGFCPSLIVAVRW